MARWLGRREREGWSWAALSRRSGHPVWKLRYWQRRLERGSRRSRRRKPAFVAVEVSEALQGAGTIAITTPSGNRVEVSNDVEPEQLRGIVEILERRC